MTETPHRRRGRKTTTVFAPTRRFTVPILAAIGVIAILAVAVVLINLALPDVALTLQGGGAKRGESIVPRNTDVWIVNADGTLRFATLFFPDSDPDIQVSEAYTVTGPLVGSAQDILKSEPFGALTANSEILPATGDDSKYMYEQYWIDRDPQSEVYGLETVTTNSPYILSGDPKTGALLIAIKTPRQDYFRQVIVAVAFAPGTQIDNIQDGTEAGAVMRPYRRVNLNGWLVYYFDTTSQARDMTIRMIYRLGKGVSTLDASEVDARR